MPMRITFTPLTREDFPLLASWLALPHVRAWWLDPEPTVESVEADYGEVVDGSDPTKAYVIMLDGEPIGMIQAFLHADEPEWDKTIGVPGVAGIDYFIGPLQHCGRGVGSTAIHDFSTLVFGFYPDVTGIVAVPLTANRASCRALEKAGYRNLGDRELETTDPSDAGINSIYLLPR